MSRANVYITQAQGNPNVSVLEKIARWVGQMLRMFGLGEGSEVEGSFGWGVCVPQGERVGVDVCDHSSGKIPSINFHAQREEILMPYLRAFSSFLDNVRRLAMTQAPPKQILEFCDKFGDVDLVPLSVALDDQEGKHVIFVV